MICRLVIHLNSTLMALGTVAVGFDAGVGGETNDDDLLYERVVSQILWEGLFGAVFLHPVRIGIINIVRRVNRM